MLSASGQIQDLLSLRLQHQGPKPDAVVHWCWSQVLSVLCQQLAVL